METEDSCPHVTSNITETEQQGGVKPPGSCSYWEYPHLDSLFPECYYRLWIQRVLELGFHSWRAPKGKDNESHRRRFQLIVRSAF